MGEQTKFLESYNPGDVIWKEGDTGDEMCIVKMGQVDCVRHMGDDEMLIKSLGANAFFGEMALFGDTQRTYTARAVKKTVIIKISKKMLDNQFAKVPEWLVNMINTIAGRIKKTSKGVKVNFDVSLEYSILRLLSLFLSEYGTPEEKGKSINLQLVRREMINILGIREEELDNCLKKLNIVNLIKILGKKDKLEVPDEERIEKFADYLITKSDSDLAGKVNLDQNLLQSFERIHKLLYR